MTKKANPKVIGGFVVGAVVLAAIGIIIFGSGKFFAEKHEWVLYFPGSVKGLSVGAPVTLQGVQIGTVIDVKVVFDRETLTFHTPVYIETFPDRIKDIGEYIGETAESIATDPDEAIKLLVERGLRAKLELQSLVTGKLQVSFSMHPGTPVHYVGLEKKVPELPTLPTAMEQLAKTLEKLPIKEMVDDVRNALAAIEKLATSPDLAEAVTALNNTLQDFGKLARNANGRLGPLVTSIEETLGDTRKLVNNVDTQVEPTFADLQKALNSADLALKQAKVTLASLDTVVGVDSAIMWELNNTLIELRSMARQVNALVSYLQRRPDALIRGKASLGR